VFGDSDKMITRETVIEKLKSVVDPELRLDVWTLGLIYDIQINTDGVVYIKMTFTTPFCPYGEVLIDQIKDAIGIIEGVKDVSIEITFEPMWQPSDEVKAMLGIG
jgi:metal-sulfur cluster biosynthetic enzyme